MADASDPPPRALHLSIADALEASDSTTAHVGRSATVADHVTVSDEARSELLRLGPVTIRVSQTWESSFRVRAPAEVEPSAGQRVPEVDIGVTREAWLIGTSTAMGGVSQIFAPGNWAAGALALAVGYAWAHWRWQQRG